MRRKPSYLKHIVPLPDDLLTILAQGEDGEPIPELSPEHEELLNVLVYTLRGRDIQRLRAEWEAVNGPVPFTPPPEF